jgi:integrase
MGLTKREDGYYVEFPVLDEGKVFKLARGVPGARVKRWKTGTNNKTMAKQQEAMIKTELMKGLIESERTKCFSFAEWGAKYLELEEVKKLKSYKERVHAVRLQLIPFFGKKPLNAILPEDIERYRMQRRLRNGGQPSLGTINNDHIILKHVFSVAERRSLLMVNPAKKVPIPDPNNERDRVLGEDEWNRLYDAAAPHVKPILLIAYQLGMRLGEIMKLTWDRVDSQRGFIKLGSGDTKTKEARLVPMSRDVHWCLTELAKVRSLASNRVFLYEGKPINGIKTAFKTAIRRAGIEDFRFHDLRHCAATNLRREGIDNITSMKIIGHKSDRMHRRYNNVNEADLLKAAARINTVITPANSAIPAKVISH